MNTGATDASFPMGLCFILALGKCGLLCYTFQSRWALPKAKKKFPKSLAAFSTSAMLHMPWSWCQPGSKRVSGWRQSTRLCTTHQRPVLLPSAAAEHHGKHHPFWNKPSSEIKPQAGLLAAHMFTCLPVTPRLPRNFPSSGIFNCSLLGLLEMCCLF